MIKKFALAAVLAITAMGSAQAGVLVNGTQGVADAGGPTADNADITLASVFTLTDIILSGNGTGDFLANPILPNSISNPARDLGGAIVDVTAPGLLTFGSAEFGTFTATSLFKFINTPGANAAVAYFVTGTFTPGSVLDAAGFGPDAQAASLTLTFNQTGGPGSSISSSATLSTPPANPPPGVGVPEPTTVVGLISGVVVLGLARLRRKTA